MKDKPTKPNGNLSTDNPGVGCWQSKEVYWDLVDGCVWIFEGSNKFYDGYDDGYVWASSWTLDQWKSQGYEFKPLPSEGVKEVKPQGNTPFKWPDYWAYCNDDTFEDQGIEGLPSVPVEEVTKVGDNVKHPNHYNQDGQIECIDAIKAALGLEGFAAYCRGNTIKYLWRYKRKGGVEDLKKSQQYLTWLIETEEEISKCSSQQ